MLFRVQHFIKTVSLFRPGAPLQPLVFLCVTGLTASCIFLVPQERLWMRSLQWVLPSQWSQHTGTPVRLPSGLSPALLGIAMAVQGEKYLHG